jgi:predicted ester cyclase
MSASDPKLTLDELSVGPAPCYFCSVGMILGRRDLVAIFGLGGAVLSSSAAKAAVCRRGDIQQRNKATIRAQIARRNAGDVPGYLSYYTEDVSNFGRVVGRAGIERIIRDSLVTFPDWHMTIEEIVAEGDVVVARFTVTGTHLGMAKTSKDGGLLKDVPPTGKTFSVQHIHWYRLLNGKVASHTANRDDVGMMVQLGLIKRP